MDRYNNEVVELSNATIDNVVKRVAELQVADSSITYGKYVASPQYKEDLENGIFLDMPKKKKKKAGKTYAYI